MSLIIAHQLYKRIELPFMNKRKAIIEYLKLEEQQHLYFNNDTDKEKNHCKRFYNKRNTNRELFVTSYILKQRQMVRTELR